MSDRADVADAIDTLTRLRFVGANHRRSRLECLIVDRALAVLRAAP